ncbi:cholesterol oxidase [Mycobacterium xenopi 4042]|uniref:Cholesterol oxidase n=1 Tax=Mycobacterium xenopi 4042 TaxID=1299334 RepID=X7YJ04_MYCXE|nr:cholesterol oxidase [Mycobacterium xenopi 4042]
MDALDAVAAQLGRPQELAQVPGGLGELVVGEPATGFEDPDAIPLLGQPKRGDAAPKPEPMISTS